MEFYGTIQGYKNYHVLRGHDIPVSDDEEIEAALLLASEFIDYRMSSVTIHTLKTGGRLQIRDWPRNGMVDRLGYSIPNDEVPREIVNATYEAAWRVLVTPGSLLKDYTPNKYSQVAVEGAVSVTFASFGSANEMQTQFAVIDAILSALIYPSTSFSTLSGWVART